MIVGASRDGLPAFLDFIEQGDFVIAADGGLANCDSLGIRPDICVGDFDSGHMPLNRRSVSLPAEKDITDVRYAIDYAMGLHFNEFFLVGCTGGRLDHFLANLFLLEYMLEKNCNGIIIDQKNMIMLKTKGTFQFPKSGFRYLSVLALTEEAVVTLKGFKYPLENHTIKRVDPLGVSNEITGDAGSVTVSNGTVIVILSSDEVVK